MKLCVMEQSAVRLNNSAEQKIYIRDQIVTMGDLQAFRSQLLDDLKFLIAQVKPASEQSLEGYKTNHVRKILGCSVNKLVSLRVSGKIRTKKLGGTLYYNKDDVRRLLQEGY